MFLPCQVFIHTYWYSGMCAAWSRILFSSVQVKICKQRCRWKYEHFFKRKKEKKTPDIDCLLHTEIHDFNHILL